MSITLLVVLIALASVATLMVLALGTRGALVGMAIDRRGGIVLSAVVFALWSVIAVSATEVTHYSGGETITASYPSVAWLAALGAVIGLISLFKAAIEEINATGGI